MKIKVIYYLVLVATILAACAKDDETIKEVPDDIIRDTTDRTELYSKLLEFFPERKPVSTLFPFLFSDTVQKRIVLTMESEVYITFISENASYKNTVGWYSYILGNEPKTVGDVNIHISFPNVSGKGEGGELMPGDMLQIGDTKFPKNTVIGFFLIIKGWQNGKIDYRATTSYTDYTLNTGGYQQHILFKEIKSGDIVLGFEDMIFESGDKDYNDILFLISDNKDALESISFDLTKLPNL